MSSITDEANQLLAIMTAYKLFSFLTKGKVIAKFADSSSMKGLNADKATILKDRFSMSSSTEGGQGSVTKNCNEKLVTMRMCARHNFEANCFQ